MKTLKKLFSVSAIVALLGTLAPMYAFGAGNSLDLDKEFPEAYAYAYKYGITTQSEDNVDMGGKLTRIAMAKMIAKYAKNVLGMTPDTSAKCEFVDVTSALDAQYDNWVTEACQLGLMGQNMPENKFRPNDLVTRAEFGTTLSRALNHDSEDLADMNKADPFYKDHLNFLNKEGIMKNISDPNMLEVRGYVMIMMMRADENYTPVEGCTAEELLKCITADDYDACIAACNGEEEPETPTNPGYAKVTTKAASTQNVALNAVEKKIGTVTLKAGENDTTVTALEITKAGLWDPKDIIGIQLMKDGQYVTNLVTSLTSKKTATLRFSPKLVIKANKSETFDVVVSLSGSNANGQHDFSVTAVTVANGDFGGTPAKLGSLVTTNYKVSDVKAKLNSSYELNAGDEKVEFAKVTLKPEVEALITAVTFTASGMDELNKKFDNVKAYIDDEVVGTVTVNDETITVNGLKETVKASKSIDVTLKWDVIYVGESLTWDWVWFYIEANHVNATETNTNERMTSSLDSSANFNKVNIQWIDLKLKNLTTKNQTVAPETSDVEFMNLEMVAWSDLEIQNFKLEASPSFETGWFEEGKVTLYIDGIDYPVTKANETYSAKSDYFTVSAGDKVSVKVVWDLTAAATGLSSIAFTFTVVDVKNTETNNTIKGVNEYKKWHTTSVKTGKPVLKETKVNSGSLLKEGADNIEVLWFSVKANNEKVTLKSAIFNISNTWVIEKVALYKEWATSALATVDELTWNDVTMTFSQSVNADATEKYVLKATLTDGTVTNLWDKVEFVLSGVTYNTASNSELTWLTASIKAEYQVASDEPTFDITKNGNRINVKVTNNSDYDIDGVAFAMKLIGEFVDGEDLLAKALLTSGTLYVKEGGNDNNILYSGKVEDLYEGNILTLAFALSIESHEYEEFVVELPEKTTIKSEYYTAEERVFGFRYVDVNDDTSKDIKARYNGAAESELDSSVVIPTTISSTPATPATPATPTVTISLSADLNLTVGGTWLFTPTVNPSDASIAWASSDTSIATVADWVVTAVASGSAEIYATATSWGVSSVATWNVVVTPAS